MKTVVVVMAQIDFSIMFGPNLFFFFQMPLPEGNIFSGSYVSMIRVSFLVIRSQKCLSVVVFLGISLTVPFLIKDFRLKGCLDRLKSCKYPFMAKCLRCWIPNPGVLCSKPLGSSKVNSAFHPSKVDEMSTKHLWELSGKK